MNLVVKYKVCGECFHDLQEVREKVEATPSNVTVALRYISRRMYADAKVNIYGSNMQVTFKYNSTDDLDNGIMSVITYRFYDDIHIEDVRMNRAMAIRYAQEVIRDETH